MLEVHQLWNCPSATTSSGRSGKYGHWVYAVKLYTHIHGIDGLPMVVLEIVSEIVASDIVSAMVYMVRTVFGARSTRRLSQCPRLPRAYLVIKETISVMLIKLSLEV